MTEKDIPGLCEVANANKDELKYTTGPWTSQWYETAFSEHKLGRAVPLTIRLEDKIIGSSRYGEIIPSIPAVEIGWTWYDSQYYGKGLNTAVKHLMLSYAFDHWKVCRLQFRVAEANKRSQRAVEKLGAVREGILRNQFRLGTGALTGSVTYSIIDEEWPMVKERLEKRLIEEKDMSQGW